MARRSDLSAHWRLRTNTDVPCQLRTIWNIASIFSAKENLVGLTSFLVISSYFSYTTKSPQSSISLLCIE